jgi:4-hydroxy-tetrahydrodipicolinate synthase
LNTVEGIHGVVVMAPGLIKYKPEEYVRYYGDIARSSNHPVYIYDLERLTGVALSVDTICRIAEVPNIAGMKLSGNTSKAAELRRRLQGSDFRLVVADPTICDILFRAGFTEHLDGLFAMCPGWASELAKASRECDWAIAAQWQAKISRLLEACLSYPLFGAFTAIMNAKGIPGRFAPEPIQMLSDSQKNDLLEKPVIRELLSTE